MTLAGGATPVGGIAMRVHCGWLVSLVLGMAILTGCQTTKLSLIAAPEDVKIDAYGRLVGTRVALEIALIDCPTTQLTFIAEPEDASIYVDGQLIGTGVASYDAGYGGLANFRRSLQVYITGPDSAPVLAVVKTRMDIPMAISRAAAVGALGLGYSTDNRSEVFPYLAVISLGLDFFTAWDFDRTAYSYRLETKDR
jgi:hypothetical protein